MQDYIYLLDLAHNRIKKTFTRKWVTRLHAASPARWSSFQPAAMPISFNFGPENDPELLAQRPKTPVTLLAGFFGAGILGTQPAWLEAL